jgi:Na+-driven multidrug efflux pump
VSPPPWQFITAFGFFWDSFSPNFAFSCPGIETHSIYALITTEAIAAINITNTIDSMAFVVFISISNASAIMIGNRIGAGEEERAIKYAWRALFLGIPFALMMGALVLLFSGTVLAYYKVSETAAITCTWYSDRAGGWFMDAGHQYDHHCRYLAAVATFVSPWF